MVSCLESEWQRFRLISGQSTVNFFLRSVGHFPEASLVCSHLLKFGAWYSKICYNHFLGGVGCHIRLVALVLLLYLLVVEPVSLAGVDESESLRIHPLVGNLCSPRIVDMADVKRQPAAVARLVGEEREVVTRCAERSHTRSHHDMPSVGRTLFYMRFGSECLELVHHLRIHHRRHHRQEPTPGVEIESFF